MTPYPTISHAVEAFTASKKAIRSKGTATTYKYSLRRYLDALKAHDIDPDKDPPTLLTVESLDYLRENLAGLAPVTCRLYLKAAIFFLEFLEGKGIGKIDEKQIKQQRKDIPKQAVRLPQFPKDGIEHLLEYCDRLRSKPTDDEMEHLRNMRDRALIITLADTGLRIHEACALERGTIDWNEGKAIIIGKGDKEAVIRFSDRSLAALKAYLNERQKLDGKTGVRLSSLALFSRHDIGSKGKIEAITTRTGVNILEKHVKAAIGEHAIGSITPHSLRHYFVTIVVRTTGNIKVAQELARHTNISITQLYAHYSDEELDESYHNVFNKGE